MENSDDWTTEPESNPRPNNVTHVPKLVGLRQEDIIYENSVQLSLNNLCYKKTGI